MSDIILVPKNKFSKKELKKLSKEFNVVIVNQDYLADTSRWSVKNV